MLVASGVFVELCSSSYLSLFNEAAPEAADPKNQTTIARLKIARASVFFSTVVIELYAGKMYQLVRAIAIIVCCCITGDESNLSKIYAEPSPLPLEDRPSIVEAPPSSGTEL